MSRVMSKTTVGLALLLGLLGPAAQAAEDDYRLGQQGTVLDDRVLYSIGGGSAVGSPSTLYRPGGIGAGVAWRANLMCGNMDLQTTVQNQLNGLTDGFRQIMGDIVQNATQAVMSLPALIIQRANPGLYELLSNGVMQGRIDFDRSRLSCQAMVERMAETVDQGQWGALARGQAMQRILDTEQDAVSVVAQSERHSGDSGVAWVGGTRAGGLGQPPIQVTGDVVRAGYNLLHGRGATDTAAPGDCQDTALCTTWPSPQAAADWAVRVLGETEVATCNGCESRRATTGTGLTPLIQATYAEHLQALQGLVEGTLPIDREHLAAVSSPWLPVSRGVVEALRDDPDQALLTRRLASETALSSVLDRALLLMRLLLAGGHEPNVASALPARQALAGNLDTLEREIRALQVEMQLRQSLASNTARRILERQAAAATAARTVNQADPEPGRLRAADQPQDAP